MMVAALAMGAASLKAQQITPGFTFSVASAEADQSVGTHFHSSTGGDFGNPSGKAEVGNFFDEEVRGLSEYNLAGLSSGSAFINIKVLSLAGFLPAPMTFRLPET